MLQTLFGIFIVILLIISICVALIFVNKRNLSDISDIPDKLIAIPLPIYVWGPRFWFVLHTVTQNYPIEPQPHDKENAVNFVTAYGKSLPCIKCKEHFAKITSEDKVVDSLGSRDAFMEWAWRIHNRANTDNGKPAVSRADTTRYFMSLQRS